MSAQDQLRKAMPKKPLVLDWFLDGRSIHWIVQKLVHMEVINCNTLTPNDRVTFVENVLRAQLEKRHSLWLEGLEDAAADIKDSIDMMKRDGAGGE